MEYRKVKSWVLSSIFPWNSWKLHPKIVKSTVNSLAWQMQRIWFLFLALSTSHNLLHLCKPGLGRQIYFYSLLGDLCCISRWVRSRSHRMLLQTPHMDSCSAPVPGALFPFMWSRPDVQSDSRASVDAWGPSTTRTTWIQVHRGAGKSFFGNLGGSAAARAHQSETCPCWAPLNSHCSSAAGLQRKRRIIPHHTAMLHQCCLCLRLAPDNTSQLIRELTAPEKNPWPLSSARENSYKVEFSRAEGRSQPCWLTSIPYCIFLIPLYSVLVSPCQPLPFLS